MQKQDIESFLARVPLFSGITPKERGAVCSALVPRQFSQDQIIVHEEDKNNQSFFVIIEGSVNVIVFTSEGKQTILATLHRGDFFGEMALLDGEPRSASVVAAEPCSLLMLYRQSFLELLKSQPTMATRMLVEMSHRLRKANRHISTLSLMSVYGRVADVILQIGKDNGRRIDSMTVVENRPTHQAIADRVGTSRETVSRVISQLQKKGYISIDRKRLVILDETKLCD